MTYNEFRQTLLNIDVSKECFKFLADRIAIDDYRGIQCSQHNRYDMDFIFTMVDELYKIAGTNKIVIRTTDIKKRPVNLPEEADYAVYVDNLSKKLGRCTQDSVRKNLFVDLHRMGLIERYKPDGTKLTPYETGTKKYVRVSELGLDFINREHTLLERKLRYTRAIDTLTKGLADELLAIVELDGTITETEFQFFFSFCAEELNGHIYTITELIEYIKEFRRLSRYQQEFAIGTVKEYCTPNTFWGDKKNKRDFHNWLNETQQIFMLMSQTAYYELDGNALSIRIGKDGVYENKEKFVRSKAEKEKYFKEHSVNKTKGFELHHIVPLCWAKNALEFATLDVWQNLIYIDGYKHSIITQSGNQHVKLDFDGDNMTFTDFTGDEVYCKKDVNVLYDASNKVLMLTYNKDLLDSYGVK